MVSLRLLTFLFILSNASKLVTGTGAANQGQVPCEDETKTVPTTTTESPTTSGDPCQAYPGTTAYRRQNGWFCSMMFYQDMQLDLPMSYKLGVDLCLLNDLPYVSSLETEQEKKDYNWLASTSKVESYWVNISFDATKGVYEWGNEHVVPTIDPQPTVIDPNGKGVWTINKDPSVPGLGSLSIVPTTGFASPNVRGIICGGPGNY
ncbi:unnamed protein product [Caenorhabditis brenneri]